MPKKIKALIIFRNVFGVSLNQIYPFRLFKNQLKETLGFCFSERPVQTLADVDIEEANSHDIVFIQLKIHPEHAGQLNEMLAQISSRKVLLDDRDSSGQCSFSAVPLVNLYVKKQVLRDLKNYQTPYRDGRIHADFIGKSFSLSSADLPRVKITEDFEQKIFTGWNIGVSERLRGRIPPNADSLFAKKRTVDVCLRLSLRNDKDWCYVHRKKCFEEVQKLSASMKVVVSQENIPRPEYYEELSQAKICPSPWGYGEVCYRDFEAILSGALLIKPSMEHLVTHPNIYIPYETYVPTKVDFSDLNDICRYYLLHENERERIARNALRAYSDYFEKNIFLGQVREMLSRTGFETEGLAQRDFNG